MDAAMKLDLFVQISVLLWAIHQSKESKIRQRKIRQQVSKDCCVARRLFRSVSCLQLARDEIASQRLCDWLHGS